MPAIYPSLIATNPSQLNQILDRLIPYCHGFHLDVMDGRFVPNVSMDIHSINAIAAKTPKPVWVHLMVQNPKAMIESLMLQPGSIVSFHVESDAGILNLINFIKEKNICRALQ
ncbi:MAG: hypothetical protein ACHQVS_02805 [Candidatus Babeliales bacterium]